MCAELRSERWRSRARPDSVVRGGTMDLQEQLRVAPIFSDFSERGIAAISELGCSRDVSAGEPLYQIGDPNELLFLVIQGEIKTYAIDGKRRVDLCTHAEGDYFGELSLFGGVPICTA